MGSLTEFFSLHNWPVIAAVALLIVNFVVQRRFQDAFLRLDDLVRQRLMERMGRFRLARTVVVIFALIGIITVASQRHIADGAEPYILGAVLLLVFAWYTVGYELMRRRLGELQLSADFVRLYLADRWLMLGALVLLVYTAWRSVPGS